MTDQVDPDWVRRSGIVLRADPTRVVTRLFLPGQEMGANGESRSTAVLNRVLALTDTEVDDCLADAMATFSSGHRALETTWDRHERLVEHRLADDQALSPARRRLIGAYFTQEYALEGAALFNPSMVEHPDQQGVAHGSVRFLMTVRAVGEGHISSIEMRTGTVDVAGEVAFDPAPGVAVLGDTSRGVYSRQGLENEIRDLGRVSPNAAFVLELLPASFTRAELDGVLDSLRTQRLTRGSTSSVVDTIDRIVSNSYVVEFPESSSVQERVLVPHGPAESNGMEDARVVKFHEADDGLDYLATYTGYDGRNIAAQLLMTDDFRRFESVSMSGPGARNKGLALFPRRIGGWYLALSRADRESNGISRSADLRHWEAATRIQAPQQPWEIVQLGNCGSPIEIEEGWLVLTHGVGPMRRYSIGALLLDRDDPTVVRGRLTTPLLTPTPDESSGYVPNVVYSCGALLHGRTLVLPYGCSDQDIRVAAVDVDGLLDALVRD